MLRKQAAWLAALLLGLGTGSCEKRQATPAAEAREGAVEHQAPARAKKGKKSRQLVESPPAGQPVDSGLRFIAYNLENWLTMDRGRIGASGKYEKLPLAPKPDSEKRAVVSILARHQPDVLGVCEIGTREDLAELQSDLKAAGLDLPYVHHAGGSDPVRHLGLLSRFPITATGTVGNLDYQINGAHYGMLRGILDASITVRGKPYRFLGAHLKSRREVDDGDQEKMRLQEAHLLRDHASAILKDAPDTRLVVYGDFNDEWGMPPIKTITGAIRTPGYLNAIRAKDNAGDYWTHYWKIHDSYSRIDYVTVSQALRPETDFDNSRIIDDPEWNAASDHRPVMAVFR